MPVPTIYTEETLAEFMHAKLGATAGILGYSVEDGSYDEAVNDTLLAYGVDNISNARDMKKIRALAKVEAWKMAAADLAPRHDFKADGGEYSRSQQYANAISMLAAAQTDAYPYDPNYSVKTTHTRDISDPYQVIPDEERTL